MGISQYRLALSISVDIDLCRGRFIALSEDFWLKMQASHDLKPAKQALEGSGGLASVDVVRPGSVPIKS